jgi:hypothetical protein
VKDAYRWRLRSAGGEKVDFSGREPRDKSACEQEVIPNPAVYFLA